MMCTSAQYAGRKWRPRMNPDIRKLIQPMAGDNVGWGTPRIHGELRKLDFVRRSRARAAAHCARECDRPAERALNLQRRARKKLELCNEPACVPAFSTSVLDV
jgi:hypothetical protein